MLDFQNKVGAIEERSSEQMNFRTKPRIKQAIQQATALSGVDGSVFTMNAANRSAMETNVAHECTTLQPVDHKRLRLLKNGCLRGSTGRGSLLQGGRGNGYDGAAGGTGRTVLRVPARRPCAERPSTPTHRRCAGLRFCARGAGVELQHEWATLDRSGVDAQDAASRLSVRYPLGTPPVRRKYTSTLPIAGSVGSIWSTGCPITPPFPRTGTAASALATCIACCSNRWLRGALRPGWWLGVTWRWTAARSWPTRAARRS